MVLIWSQLLGPEAQEGQEERAALSISLEKDLQPSATQVEDRKPLSGKNGLKPIKLCAFSLRFQEKQPA